MKHLLLILTVLLTAPVCAQALKEGTFLKAVPKTSIKPVVRRNSSSAPYSYGGSYRFAR